MCVLARVRTRLNDGLCVLGVLTYVRCTWSFLRMCAVCVRALFCLDVRLCLCLRGCACALRGYLMCVVACARACAALACMLGRCA